MTDGDGSLLVRDYEPSSSIRAHEQEHEQEHERVEVEVEDAGTGRGRAYEHVSLGNPIEGDHLVPDEFQTEIKTSMTMQTLDSTTTYPPTCPPGSGSRDSSATLIPIVTNDPSSPSKRSPSTPDPRMGRHPRSGSDSERLYMPKLNGWAKSWGRKRLGKVTLQEIMDGASCSPISFNDFQQFLCTKEHTPENLSFLIWYHSYSTRFDKLSEQERKRVDVPSKRLADLKDPFGHLNEMGKGLVRSWREGSLGAGIGVGLGMGTGMAVGKKRNGSVGFGGKVGFGSSSSSSLPLTPQSPSPPSPTPLQPSPPSQLQTHSESDQTRYTPYQPKTDPASQPMRKEAQLAFDTFLKPGCKAELNLTHEMRVRTEISLRGSTHPDVFEPIYREIWAVVEDQSLPHFLSYAQTNINLPKQLFWYAVGLTDIGISILILLLMVWFLPDRPFAWRTARLVSLLFAAFGAMQVYSAWRGFCTQVWGRVARQVHPWEMIDLDQTEIDTGAPEAGGTLTVGTEWKNPWEDQPPAITGEGKVLPVSPVMEKEVDRSNAFPLTTSMTSLPMSQSTFDKDPGTRDEWFDYEPFASTSTMVHHLPPRDIMEISPWEDPIAVPPHRPTGEAQRGDNKAIFPLTETIDADPEGSREASSTLRRRRQTTRAQQSKFLDRILNRSEEGDDPATLIPEIKKRPAVFGDETIVVDERVIDLHKSVIKDILVFGAIWSVIWIAICLAIPPR